MTTTDEQQPVVTCTDCGDVMPLADRQQHMAEMHGVMYAPYEKGLAVWFDEVAQECEASKTRVLEIRAHHDCTECTDQIPCERAQRWLSGGDK